MEISEKIQNISQNFQGNTRNSFLLVTWNSLGSATKKLLNENDFSWFKYIFQRKIFNSTTYSPSHSFWCFQVNKKLKHWRWLWRRKLLFMILYKLYNVLETNYFKFSTVCCYFQNITWNVNQYLLNTLNFL